MPGQLLHLSSMASRWMRNPAVNLFMLCLYTCTCNWRRQKIFDRETIISIVYRLTGLSVIRTVFGIRRTPTRTTGPPRSLRGPRRFRALPPGHAHHFQASRTGFYRILVFILSLQVCSTLELGPWTLPDHPESSQQPAPRALSFSRTASCSRH